MTCSLLLIEDLAELMNEHGGMDSVSEAMSLLMDSAMPLKRTDVLEALPYEKSATRQGYVKGFKPKTLHTCLGNGPLRVPKVRADVSFYPLGIDQKIRNRTYLDVGCRGGGSGILAPRACHHPGNHDLIGKRFSVTAKVRTVMKT